MEYQERKLTKKVSLNSFEILFLFFCVFSKIIIFLIEFFKNPVLVVFCVFR